MLLYLGFHHRPRLAAAHNGGLGQRPRHKTPTRTIGRGLRGRSISRSGNAPQRSVGKIRRSRTRRARKRLREGPLPTIGVKETAISLAECAKHLNQPMFSRLRFVQASENWGYSRVPIGHFQDIGVEIGVAAKSMSKRRRNSQWLHS